jgi:hypothetical protein
MDRRSSQVAGLALHATAAADAHPKDSGPFCKGHCVCITLILKTNEGEDEDDNMENVQLRVSKLR